MGKSLKKFTKKIWKNILKNFLGQQSWFFEESEDHVINEELDALCVWACTILALANVGVSLYYCREVYKMRADQIEKEDKENEESLEEKKEKEFHQIAEPSTEYYRNQQRYIFNFCDTFPWN